jgi:hypothetical protein
VGQILEGAKNGGEWSQYIQLTVDFKPSDVKKKKKKSLKVIKHFQISQQIYRLGGATVRHVKWSVKLCEMECQTVGQFKGTF